MSRSTTFSIKTQTKSKGTEKYLGSTNQKKISMALLISDIADFRSGKINRD